MSTYSYYMSLGAILEFYNSAKIYLIHIVRKNKANVDLALIYFMFMVEVLRVALALLMKLGTRSC